MRKVAFLTRSFDEFNQWVIEDKKIYAKIVNLIKDIQSLVYIVSDQEIVIVSCKFHY